MRHQGYYTLSMQLNDDNEGESADGDIYIEDSDIYLDDTGLLDPEEKNTFYRYREAGWTDDQGFPTGRWKKINSSTVDKLQDMWENREVNWFNCYGEVCYITIVKFRNTVGTQLSREDIIDELEQGLKALAWELIDDIQINVSTIMEGMEKYVDEIIDDMNKKEGSVLEDLTGGYTEQQPAQVAAKVND